MNGLQRGYNIDESPGPEWLKDGDISTPLISSFDIEWECPPFSISDTNFSTADSISQIMISPVLLHNPTTSSPFIIHQPVAPTFGSPIVSSLLKSRRPLASSLLDESLDISAPAQLQVAASLQTLDHDNVTPRATPMSWVQPIGLGFVDVATASTAICSEVSSSPECQNYGSDSMEDAGQESISSTEASARSGLDDHSPQELSTLTGAESLKRRKGVSRRQFPSK